MTRPSNRQRHRFRLPLILLAFLSPAAAHAQEYPPGYFENYKPSYVFTEKNSLRPQRTIGSHANAATAYFDAWDMIPRQEFLRFNELAANIPEPDKKLSPELRAALLEHSDYIDALLRAANTDHCDWGIDWDAGWECLLPHLGWTRSSCRALAADARRCIEDNSPIAAIERIKAILKIGQHASEGPILISSLVGIAIINRAAQLTTEFLDQNRFTPAHARALLKAFRAIPRGDLCHARAAIAKERQITMEWLRQMVASAQPGADYMRLMRTMGIGTYGMDRFVQSLSRDQFEKDIARADRVFELLEQAWTADNPLPRLDELSEEISEFQYGLLAFNMVPAVGKARVTVTRAQQALATLESRLERLTAPENADLTPPQQSQEATASTHSP